MANKNPNPKTRFKKGKSGNPNGRPALPEEILKAKKLNRIELERVLNEYVNLSLAEIKSRVENPNTPALEVIIAKIIFEGAKKGDEKRLGFILDRLVGVLKRKVSLDGGEDGSPIGISVSQMIADEIENIENNLPDDEKQFED